MMRAYYAAALSTLWNGVVTVKLRSSLWDPTIGKGIKPCEKFKTGDIWVSKFTKQTRVVCEGEQAYFVMKREVGVREPKYMKLYGGDDEILEKYGLNLDSMIKSSWWNQEKFGFVENWDTSGRLKLFLRRRNSKSSKTRSFHALISISSDITRTAGPVIKL